jgi:hypothetical protein
MPPGRCVSQQILIDLEEDKATRAVVFGLLAEVLWTPVCGDRVGPYIREA